MPTFPASGSWFQRSEDGKRAANDEEVRNAGKLDQRRIPRSNQFFWMTIMVLIWNNLQCFFVCICVGLVVGNHDITVSAS